MAYDSGTTQMLQLAAQSGKTTTARVFYTYDGLSGSVFVQPSTAIPLAVQGSNQSSSTTFNWATASAAGYPISGHTIQLQGVPLGQTNTEIAIELLQPFTVSGGSTQEYVVAYYCYQGPPSPLTTAQLQADSAGTHTFVKGRTCGGCTLTQTYNGTDPTPPQGGACP